MKPMKLSLTAIAALTLISTGCVDSNYSLSDVDTQSRFQVNDLTIPVNIDVITLADILDVKDSKIKAVTIDGNEFYAFIENGTFDSDGISVNSITATAPVLSPTSRTLSQVKAEQQRATPSADSRVYEILDMGNDFDYHADNIDESILDVESITVRNFRFAVHLTTHDVEESAESEIFNDLVIELPKGMTATPSHGEYDPATGLWTIDDFEVLGTETDAWVDVSRLNLKENGVTIADDRTMDFSGAFYVRSGFLTIEPKKVNGVPMPLPETLEFSADYTLNDLKAETFSGVIEYSIKGMDIAPISLSDIPDFLNGDGTVLKLANPQIYMNLDNPVADKELGFSTGLLFTARHRHDTPETSFSPSGNVNVGYQYGSGANYNFVLAPSDKGLAVPEDYTKNLSYIPFPGLGDILAPPAGSSVGGLPTEILISVVNPELPRQNVSDFSLGVTIPGIKGQYEFMAPLALNDGSVIIYTDTADGWNSDDLDGLTITHLSATLDVTNNLQFDGELAAYPIDVDGNRIPGVEITTSKIMAGCTDTPVTIQMTGTITHLDGVIFTATLNSAGNKPLTPSETVTLRNIRVKVSGYYDKKL